MKWRIIVIRVMRLNATIVSAYSLEFHRSEIDDNRSFVRTSVIIAA